MRINIEAIEHVRDKNNRILLEKGKTATVIGDMHPDYWLVYDEENPIPFVVCRYDDRLRVI